MNVLDVCAGIGSFSEAAHRTGFASVCQIEIQPTRQSVLAKHFPDTQRLSDLTKVSGHDITKTVDIICGGTPCQDLSIAGHGKGLAGARSGLWYEYLRLARELKPQWLVWENVANALSSNAGRDFRQILMGLDECGYHVAWRVLDAQYFGVPQRRRRIFLVASLRDGRAAQVLFESASVPGNSNTRPEAWKNTTRIAGTLSKSASGTARTGNGNEVDLLVESSLNPCDVQSCQISPENGIAKTLAPGGDRLHSYPNVMQAKLSKRQLGFGDYVEDGTASAIKKRDSKNATDLVIDLQQVTSKTNMSKPGTISGAMTTHSEKVTYSSNATIRRLTPTECARLQGFPDDWLDGLGLSDKRKYEMLGDTIALPCSEWIMRRIAQLG